MWSVCGGLLLYFLTCNFLTLLVKPSWDEPIRTISDLLERDMGLIMWPNDYFIGMMRDSPVDQYNEEGFIIQKLNISFHPVFFQVAKKTVAYSDWDITYQKVKES